MVDWRTANPYLRIAIAVALLAVASAAAWLMYDAGYFDRKTLAAVAEAQGYWAIGTLIGAMILAVVVGPIPTIPITMASGLVFGPLAGFAIAWAGAMLGATASFWIARGAGQPLVERLAGRPVALCPNCSQLLLFWVVVGCRLFPFISFALVSYSAGLTAMTTFAFLLATGLGMAPMTLLFVTLGASVAIDPLWAAIATATAVGLVALIPWAIERWNPFGLRDIFRQSRAD